MESGDVASVGRDGRRNVECTVVVVGKESSLREFRGERLDAFVALLPDESQTRSVESAIESDDCAFVRNGATKHLTSWIYEHLVFGIRSE